MLHLQGLEKEGTDELLLEELGAVELGEDELQCGGLQMQRMLRRPALPKSRRANCGRRGRRAAALTGRRRAAQIPSGRGMSAREVRRWRAAGGAEVGYGGCGPTLAVRRRAWQEGAAAVP